MAPRSLRRPRAARLERRPAASAPWAPTSLVAATTLALLGVGMSSLAGVQASDSSESRADVHPPLPGLRRVIVLARHGNRAPNPQVETLCPRFARHEMPKFGVAPAALSLVGMAENNENGRFLRHRYREFLPPGAYIYDGTFAFFSERVERNIVATAALARGVFPFGTGIPGFAPERPNIVPISTTQDGADVLMNCPRDGPCQRALSKDKKKWVDANEDNLYEKHKNLFRVVSEACGYLLEPGKIEYEGKKKSLTWALKAVMDLFSFSDNEGLDATLGGRINMTVIKEFKEVVEGMVQDMNFGSPHQITYWTGDFIPTFLGLARVPLKEEVNKLHVFLNHRELIYAVATMLGMPIQFPGLPAGALPSGCSIILEVYDEGVRMFFWQPTQPDHETKAKYLKERRSMAELYSYGDLFPTKADGCEIGQPCPVEALAFAFVKFVTQTGTYVKLCNVSREETYFAQGEASLGVMEHWVQPEQLAALRRRFGLRTAPVGGKPGDPGKDLATMAEDLGFTEDDVSALGLSLSTVLAAEPALPAANGDEDFLEPAAAKATDAVLGEAVPGRDGGADFVAWLVMVALPMSLATFWAGWWLGERSSRGPSARIGSGASSSSVAVAEEEGFADGRYAALLS